MRINFTPQRRDDTLEIYKNGDILTINGDELDLTVLPDGATLPNVHEVHPLLSGSLSRINGEITITFILPHGANPPYEAAFPSPIFDVQDGLVPIPGSNNG